MWSDLSYPTPEDDPAYTEAQRRVLGRLGEYAEAIITPLNLRPTSAVLLSESRDRVEVRVSTPGSHTVLVIAPEGDLAPEVFFLRSLAVKNLPAPRLIGHDLSCSRVPFTYALESYIGGVPLSQIDDAPLIGVAARQVGRALRKVHQLAAPGFGRPTLTGRWPTRAWVDVLAGWLAHDEVVPRATELLGAPLAAQLWAATIEHPALACAEPSVIHGAFGPERAIVTVGESVQFEALVRPGAIVGGDPLFDLASGLLPHYPQPFRQGLIEGYTRTAQLTPHQEDRLRRLCLLLSVADAVRDAEEAALERLARSVETQLVHLREGTA